MTERTTLTDFDYSRLSTLAKALSRPAGTRGSPALAERLRNAIVFKENELPATFVRMQSTAKLTDLGTGESYVYRLVFPAEADIACGRISVLSPFGAAMLGRQTGEVFSYQSPGGTVRMRVEEIVHELP